MTITGSHPQQAEGTTCVGDVDPWVKDTQSFLVLPLPLSYVLRSTQEDIREFTRRWQECVLV